MESKFPGGESDTDSLAKAKYSELSHTLRFSRGEIRMYRISPGEKLTCVAFLLGSNSHALRLKFARGETRMCRISPGEKLTCVAFLLGRIWY